MSAFVVFLTKTSETLSPFILIELLLDHFDAVYTVYCILQIIQQYEQILVFKAISLLKMTCKVLHGSQQGILLRSHMIRIMS